MSSWKITKGILGAQAIMMVIATVVFFVIGLVPTKNKTKKTKDGFQTNEMQKLYNHYVEKEMKYGQS